MKSGNTDSGSRPGGARLVLISQRICVYGLIRNVIMALCSCWLAASGAMGANGAVLSRGTGHVAGKSPGLGVKRKTAVAPAVPQKGRYPRMVEAYHTSNRNPSPDRPERRGVTRRPVIEAAKEALRTIDLADLLCGPAGNRSGLLRIGDKWVGRCPLPDCAAKLPSFVVWPDNGSWHCFCCVRGGNATDLARLAGYALAPSTLGR